MSSQPAEAPEVLYLVATSGHPNYGDEFITAAWLRFLARTRPEAEVWLDCPEPGAAIHLFDGLHPRLRITNTLWTLVHELKKLAPAEADSHGDRVIEHLGTPRFDTGLLTVRRATTVHFLGGGYLHALWPHHLRLLRLARKVKEVTGARLVATGLGLQPVHDLESLRDDLAAFDHVSVRDQPSAEAAGVSMTCDDAFLALPSVPGYNLRPGSEEESDEVYVCLQNDIGTPENFDHMVDLVAAALERPEYADRPVFYVEAIPGSDRIAFERLGGLIPEENFVSFVKLWGEGFPGRPGQTWITTRFHLHLLAASCGAEGTAIEVDEEFYRVKHGSLVDAGTGWALTTVGATELAAPSGAGEFRLDAGRLHRAKLEEAEGLYPRRSRPAAPAQPEQPPAAEERARSASAGWFRRR